MQHLAHQTMLKFVFSRRATKIDEINGEDFIKFCGLLRKNKLYTGGEHASTI